MTDDIRCPACGQVVADAAAEEKAEDDSHAPLTCPTCGAGFDRDGNLVHEPAIGP
jgi:DNA-directed RNA polymerase subunit RPC12/RpoP